LLAFIYIARGSAGEVRSMLCLLLRRDWAKHLKSEISNLKSTAESCSRQLRGWADSLQNSEIKGRRHLNDRVRKEQDQKQRAVTFQKQLLGNLPANHPLRRQAEEKEREQSKIWNFKFETLTTNAPMNIPPPAAAATKPILDNYLNPE
jgi:hypothetical protein